MTHHTLASLAATALIGAILLVGTEAAIAQQANVGQVVTSSAGRAGQRQGRDDTTTGIAPMARVDSRVQNRVQSRLRTRIDRTYDPQANATSPFETAADRARTAGRTRRP